MIPVTAVENELRALEDLCGREQRKGLRNAIRVLRFVLGWEPRPLSVDVLYSPPSRAALELLGKPVICGDCHGTGLRWWNEAMPYTCDHCEGKGAVGPAGPRAQTKGTE